MYEDMTYETIMREMMEDMPDDVDGFEYITKGLFGGYLGYFSVKQYYKTIFEYGNMENRDIWEYDLNLTKEETMKLFNHLWEMQGIGSYYYFFDALVFF